MVKKPATGTSRLGESRRLQKLKLAFVTYGENDILLNQPGRAFARCVLWWLTALAFGLPPVGVLCLQIARIDSLYYVFGNIAGLFLGGSLSLLFFAVVLVVALIAHPILGPSTVPHRRYSENRSAK